MSLSVLARRLQRLWVQLPVWCGPWTAVACGSCCALRAQAGSCARACPGVELLRSKHAWGELTQWLELHRPSRWHRGSLGRSHLHSRCGRPRRAAPRPSVHTHEHPCCPAARPACLSPCPVSRQPRMLCDATASGRRNPLAALAMKAETLFSVREHSLGEPRAAGYLSAVP